MLNNECKLVGAVSVNKSGVKARPVFGGVAHSGWFIKVVDGEGRHLIASQVKTMDESIALTLADGGNFELSGYFKSENWEPNKDKPANWVTVFYAEDANELASNEPAL